MNGQTFVPPRQRSLWFPQTLAARVFLVFGLTTSLAVLTGLGLLNYQQYQRHVTETRAATEKLAEVVVQPISDSAVVADYDAIRRLLTRLVPDSPLREAVFVDASGGTIRASADHADDAPQWLDDLVARSMPPLERTIVIGGRRYGQVTLRYDTGHVASDLWDLLLKTATLAALGLALSLVAMRYAIRRWLRNLDSLQLVEAEVLAGTLDAQAPLSDDAPLEIRNAIEVINRTAGSLRAQFGQRIDTLMHSLIQHKNAMDEATIVCELDPQGRLTSANDGFLNAVGLSLRRLVGQRIQDIGLPADAPAEPAPSEPGAKPWEPSRDIWRGQVQVVDVFGKAHTHRRSIVPIFDGSGEVEKYICIDFDITVQKASEQALRDQVHRQNIITTFGRQALEGDDLERLMRQAMEWVCAGLDVHHAALLLHDGRTPEPRIAVGVGWEHGWLGKPAQKLVGYPASEVRLAIPGEMLQAHGIRSVLSTPSESGSDQAFTLVAASPQARLFRDADSDFLRSLAHVLSAAMDRHRSRERLTYLARFDGLTGLPNRGLLFDRMEAALAVARSQGTRVGLLYLDLDRFKLVNDTLGHEAGDHLLVQAAHRMVGCLRASDTVARLAGDEFAILLPGLDGSADAERVARKVLAQLGRSFELNGQEVFVSASVGAVLYPDHGLDTGTLVRCADQAMYHSKNAGRNEFRFYSEEMSEREADRLEIGTRLRAALEREEFFLAYQPRVDLETGRISGLEALLRWTHPERGPISPADFVPVLEDTGLIIGVGEWVLRAVARQIMQWQAQGLAVPRVAINLSARQFASRELDAQVRAVLAETGVDPSMLEFELTESMLMHEPAQAVATLEHFRSYGLRLSVDDFGTGYSSLSYLRRFPLDALKVDRAFVRDLATDPDDMAIALAIISLSHSLKLKVVAEGVETTEQLDLLADAGCDEVQGFYFCRPVPPQEIERMLREGTALQWQPVQGAHGQGHWRLPAPSPAPAG